MAQSKVDAQAFKDNYTNSLIKLGREPQITPQAEATFGRMPEQDLGEIASVYVNTTQGTTTLVNDGIGKIIVGDADGAVAVNERSAAYPLKGQPRGIQDTKPNTRDMHLAGEAAINMGYKEGVATRWDKEKMQEYKQGFRRSPDIDAYPLSTAINQVQGFFGMNQEERVKPYGGMPGSGYTSHDFAREVHRAMDKVDGGYPVNQKDRQVLNYMSQRQRYRPDYQDTNLPTTSPSYSMSETGRRNSRLP